MAKVPSIAFAMALLFLASAAQGQEQFVGVWKGTYMSLTTGRSRDITFTFTLENGSLAGKATFYNPGAKTRSEGILSDIKAEGKALSFKVTHKGGGWVGTTASYRLVLEDAWTLKGRGENPARGTVFDISLKKSAQ